MEAQSKSKEELFPPPLFSAAVSKVAVAQICRTVGYHGAEPAAIRSLADVAARYIAVLARSAASIASARGRTQCNLLDLIRAMESLSLPRGFTGCSDPARPPLESGVLTELMGFVGSVDEIPFPKPIRRPEAAGIPRGASPPSFAQMGRDPPFANIPRWLPCFPESWWKGKTAERDGIKEEGEARRTAEDDGGGRRRVSEAALETILPAVRERVRFKLGFGKRCDAGVTMKRRKKKVSSSSYSWNWGSEEEESGGKRMEPAAHRTIIPA